MEGANQTLSKSANERARSRDYSQLRRLFGFLVPYRSQLVGALIALVVAAAAMLSLGVGVRHLIDGGFGQRHPDALNHALWAVLIVVAVLAAATFARTYLVTWLGERVMADLRREVFARVVRLSPGFFETTRTGEVISRLTTDTSVIQAVIASSVTQALRNVLLVLGGIAILLVTNPKLTGLVLLVVPLVVVPIVIIGRRVRIYSRLTQDRIGEVGAITEETLNAVRTVQAFGRERAETTRLGGATEEAFRAAAKYALARGTLGAIVIGLVFGSIVVVLWVGGLDVLAGRLTGGELASFVFYAAIVASAVGGLSDVASDLQRAAGAAERLFELMDREPLIPVAASPRPLPEPARGAVRFENVTFAYPSQPDRVVLENLTLEVRAGETVALVGPSGAGKTSLFQLAMRFYDPQEGQILVDGVDIRDVDPLVLRARIGLVPQEPVIFSADARSNIAYGGRLEPVSDEAVENAARAAAADEFIRRLPDGYATFLGEKGVRLSGGQRQRVAIARALLRDPALLLLDEATSALDAESERLVQHAIERLRRGRTCLVIAHRLATVRDADRIVVIDRGRVVDEGDHDSLISRGGLYSRLATLQFALDRAA